MISHISRSLRITSLSFMHFTSPFFYTAAKKLRDSDELTIKQMEDLLGRSIEPEQSKIVSPQAKQQTSMAQKDKTYFYGLLPLKSENYPECVDPYEIAIEQTPNQNIFKALQLPDNCSFDQYALALNKFRTSMDLYGEEEEKSVIENNSLEFKEILQVDSEYIERVRKYHMVNISIPGTIECEDPRNFMELRPVEEFRHTPLVPISQSYMQRHKEMLERYHRKQFVFEVSTEKTLNWLLIAACLGVAGYMIHVILEKEEERTVNFSRLKHQRLMGEGSEKPVFKI